MHMTIGERVLKQRRALGLNQTDLAKKARISQALIARIESGSTKNPGAEMVKRLARALAVTADYLIGMYDDDPTDSAALMAVGASP